ncbi:hypothetical protein [Marinomonas gallaica]|uniref:hypothetical protein n=1 Tax=Marinomonas gallaica TaxID=1806667 RepID=UPI003A95AA60
MLTRAIPLASIALFTSACSMMPGTAFVKEVDTQKYSSFQDLIAHEFSDPSYFQVANGNLSSGILVNNEKTFYHPINTLRNYCSRFNGSVQQLQTRSIDGLNDTQYGDSVGLFSCIYDDQVQWLGDINVINPRYSNLAVRVITFKSFTGEQYNAAVQKRREQVEAAKRYEAEKQAAIEKVKAQEKLNELNRLAEREIELKNRKDMFQKRLNIKKTIGSSICSWNNSIGYVEAVTDNKIKVQIAGKVLTNANDKGLLFSSKHSDKLISKDSALIWADKNDWAFCDYQLEY